MTAAILVLMMAPVDPVPRLVSALDDTDPDVRANLGVALARLSPASVAPLTAALKDSNAVRRAGAAYALGLIGEEAKDALPTLLDLLGDETPDVRRQASYALSRVIMRRSP